MNSSLELVVFDCDGVLVDSEPIASGAVAAALKRFGLHVTPLEIMSRYTGISAPAMYADIEKRHALTLTPEQQQEVSVSVQEALATSVLPMPDIDLALLKIASRFKVCVASSSSPERIAASLSRAGLSQFFGTNIFSASQVAHGKPAPDIFLFAANAMGVESAKCCVVEDSTAGVEAAIAARMRVMGFVGGGHGTAALADALRGRGANPVFRDMRNLPELLSSLKPI